MNSLFDRRAVVLGGSSGVGRATVTALQAEGARVTAVARGQDRLDALAAELGGAAVAREGGTVDTRAGDAADAAFTERLLREVAPSLVVVALGAHPRMEALERLDWGAFSATWDTDVRVTFQVFQQSLLLPLAPGSTVVVVSSGAGLRSSPLSGGYAGAKRMQMLLADYAQASSDRQKLGIRFAAVVPDQLLTGTAIGARAAAAYGALQGVPPEVYMERFGAPLGVDGVASAIVNVLRGDIGSVRVRGSGVEALT